MKGMPHYARSKAGRENWNSIEPIKEQYHGVFAQNVYIKMEEMFLKRLE